MKKVLSEENSLVGVNEVVSSKRKSRKSLIVGLIFLILIIFTLFFYNKVRVLEKDPSKVNEEKIMKVVNKVERLIEVPKGEVPTLAKITDTKPLEGNEFFKDAKIGYEVLFYPTSGKIYLYDPETDIIINATTINTDLGE